MCQYMSINQTMPGAEYNEIESFCNLYTDAIVRPVISIKNRVDNFYFVPCIKPEVTVF